MARPALPKSPRPDSAVYQKALAELRQRHAYEFEEIRQRLLSEAGFENRVKVRGPRRRSQNVMELCDRALTLIQSQLDVWGRAPLPIEIAGALGVPRQTARYLLLALEADGRIVREGPERRVRVVREPDEMAS